ncbi:tyrosine-type recombinase/integrase [Oscillatoriales cyanobacterium LEGE 11467]|uniref:Tyrosine-type recombinase/integrase n=1 Tax=Zarconia navalis LEGE 11467 TaxID=1828826 RepID=A0A928VX86_9CYAN|nr:tyrosine-type recombinase/integrase [Zarconia navalis LEGE 11467]
MSHSLDLSTSELLELWLHGKSPNTVSSYRRHVEGFFQHAAKPLTDITLLDIQTWQLSLSRKSPASQQTALAALKSLLSFGHQLGILKVNVGKLARSPKAKDRLSERILSEAEVRSIIDGETGPRNRTILRLLYSGGLRVSELCALKWCDFKPRHSGGQITVFGKGGHTRTVLLSPSLWENLWELRGDSGADDPVFRSRQVGLGGSYHLSRKQVYRIVRTAARRARIEGNVSPHWLRHSHASHSLDRGAPIHLVRQTLGHSSITITEKYLHARPDDSSALYLDD